VPVRRRILPLLAVAVAAGLTAAAPAQATVNDLTCKPPARHPYPVVVLHGTAGDMGITLPQIAPALERLGYCVFALDYGGGRGLGDIEKSAAEISAFVDRVRTATGARRVSFVGHSQGGMLPRYIIKFLGGDKRVDDVVGLSPSSHGTTSPAAPLAGAVGCVACSQQIAGSPFMQKLNAGNQTPAPVSYTVIETRFDEIVTPFDSEFLPATPDGRVTNVLLQDRCPGDSSDHVAIIYDQVALQWMLNALGRRGPADPAFVPDCTGAALATFPNSNSGTVPGDPAGGPSAQVRGTLRVLLPAGGVRHGRRAFTVALAAQRGLVRSVVVRVLRGRTLVARSAPQAVAAGTRRSVRLLASTPLKRGRYSVVAKGRDFQNAVVSATAVLRVR
jgi:triacylglycerol lipase